ncbi:MAG TPA: tRNA lysidine(34) synthetase TilS [Jiangellaceae bacterium]
MPVAHLDVRRAVRAALADLPAGSCVLVACSGGGDSLALAAALAHVARRSRLRAGGITVDHGLQDGSAERGREVGAVLTGLGLDPVEVVHVRAHGRAGPEGNARAARYAALDAAAVRHAASAVLLGHTRDDQAETVLLGLARGSGARSLAGMAARSGAYRRPLLELPRDLVRAGVPAELRAWDDPHNADAAYARSRVRHRVLPTLEDELGPGVSAALARTADLLRADADALDDLAAGAYARTCRGVDAAVVADVAGLVTLPRAVRWRVIRRAAIGAGSPATDLGAAHVAAADALVTGWRGQVGIDLPGGVRVVRRDGELRFAPPE